MFRAPFGRGLGCEDNAALSGRYVGVHCGTARITRPPNLELFARGVRGVADPDPKSDAIGPHGTLGIRDPVQPGVCWAPCFDRIDCNLDARWPVVALQPVETTSFLEIADQNNASRSADLSFLVGFGEGFSGGDHGVAQPAG